MSYLHKAFKNMIDSIYKCQDTMLGTQHSITGSSKKEIKHLSKENSYMGSHMGQQHVPAL